MTRLADAETQRLVDADSYAAHGYPHEIWTQLRREQPVAWIEPMEFEPYWAVTKHRDIRAISMQHERFSSRGRNILISRAAADMSSRSGAREHRVDARRVLGDARRQAGRGPGSG